jgi:thymidylate synthase
MERLRMTNEVNKSDLYWPYHVQQIRNEFQYLLAQEQFVTDKTGVKTIEIVGASFIADEPAIFGEPNEDYIARELEWYNSQSLKVADIPGKTPAIWEQVAGKTTGEINSNYGYLIYSSENENQYFHVLRELQQNPWSRRAVMIYQRPSMHVDYNHDGMSDFICTNAVQYVIREPVKGYHALSAIVQMRSNDAYFGYRNDYAWQKHVLDKLAGDLGVNPGNIYWNAGSLHVYERHFDMVANA